MFENKNIKRLVYGFLIAVSVFISLSSENIAWLVMYDILDFLPKVVLYVLSWVLFSDKLIRAGMTCIAVYWLYDFFLACLFRIDKDLAKLLNTKLAYLLSIVLGIILFSFYLWIRRKNKKVWSGLNKT